MSPKDIRNMVAMVRAIRAGKWTDEIPAWAEHHAKTPAAFGAYLGAKQAARVLQELPGPLSAELRAVQTAEAFILLAHASETPFDETRFLRDCGFTR